MPDISIIVPIYNAEKYLNKCLDSLINQTKKELEFILINDGSTDKTEGIIKEYSDERIKYFKNKNQGIGKTRNFGIKKATGKYIMFLDSDDYLDIKACEKLYNEAEKNKLDLLVFDFYRVEENTLKKVKIKDFKISNLKENPNLLLEINLGPCNKIIRRKIITKNNPKFLENLKYEDTPFVVQIIKYSKRIGKLNETLHYYVIHKDSETTIRDEKIFDIIKVVDIIRKDLKNDKYLKEASDSLTVRIITNYTVQQRVQENKKVGMKFIDEAFSYLKKEVPDYKNNKYYENRGFLRRTIEKSKILTKTYCKIYPKKEKEESKITTSLIKIFYFIASVIFIYLLYNIIFKNTHFLIHIKSYQMILGTVLYLFFIYLISKLLDKFVKNEKKYVTVSLIIFFLLQLLFAYFFAVDPSWDFGAVYEGALESIYDISPLSNYYYFYVYSNNLAYGIYLTAFFKILNIIGISNHLYLGIAGILLNIISIDISLVFIYKILKEIFPNKIRKAFWLMTILFTPFITYVPIFYTDTLSLPFIAGALYFIVKIIKENKKKINIILSGLLLGIGYTINPTTIIILIALGLYLIIFSKYYHNLIKRFACFLAIVLLFLIPSLVVKVYMNNRFDQELLEKVNYPITHWLMMGLTLDGGYNDEDVIYTRSFEGIENKKQANLKVIKERVNNLIKDKKVLNFYTNKAIYTWGDGTYFATSKLSRYPLKNNNFKRYILLGDDSNLFTIIAQAQMLLTIIFMIIGMFNRKYLNKIQQDLQLFLIISIFGIFLFLLLWEARSRYLVSSAPLLLLETYIGIEATLQKRKRVEK